MNSAFQAALMLDDTGVVVLSPELSNLKYNDILAVDAFIALYRNEINH